MTPYLKLCLRHEIRSKPLTTSHGKKGKKKPLRHLFSFAFFRLIATSWDNTNAGSSGKLAPYTRAHIRKSISGEPASFEYDYGAMSMRSPIHTLFRLHILCLHVLSSRLVRTSHRLEVPPKWLPQPHVTDLEDPDVEGSKKKIRDALSCTLESILCGGWRNSPVSTCVGITCDGRYGATPPTPSNVCGTPGKVTMGRVGRDRCLSRVSRYKRA